MYPSRARCKRAYSHEGEAGETGGTLSLVCSPLPLVSPVPSAARRTPRSAGIGLGVRRLGQARCTWLTPRGGVQKKNRFLLEGGGHLWKEESCWPLD